MTKIKKISEAFSFGKSNTPPRLFLAYGPDRGFVRQAIETLSNELLKSEKDLEVRNVFDGDLSGNFAAFENSITNASLFGGASLAIVRLQNESQSSKILELLERVESGETQINGACYFECHDFSAKSKLVQGFENSTKAAALRLFEPTKAEYTKLLKDIAQEEQVIIDQIVIDRIIETSAQDSISIVALVRSLALYVGRGGKIDESVLLAMGENSREAGVDEVLSAAFLGESKIMLLRAYQAFGNDVNPIVVLNQLLRRVKALLSLRLAIDGGKSVTEVVEDKRSGIFWKEQPNYAKQLAIWPRSALESVLSKIIATDIECKKRGANSEALVENTLLGIAEYAARRR